jgi:hypothetical protein
LSVLPKAIYHKDDEDIQLSLIELVGMLSSIEALEDGSPEKAKILAQELTLAGQRRTVGDWAKQDTLMLLALLSAESEEPKGKRAHVKLGNVAAQLAGRMWHASPAKVWDGFWRPWVLLADGIRSKKTSPNDSNPRQTTG